jgi:hypothetical protein
MNELKEKLVENNIDLTLQSMGGKTIQPLASCAWGCSEGACTTGGCTITTCMFATSCPGGPVCSGNGCTSLSAGNTCGTATPTCATSGCSNDSGGTCGTGTCSGNV